MRYRMFHAVDHWVIAAQLGERYWRVVDRADDELAASVKLDGYSRKKVS